MAPQEVIDALIESNLRGRGGAFFPTGRKASFVPTPDKVAKPIYLTVNADESEPGTFKDREIMLRVPHRLDRGLPHRGARDPVAARLHLHPRRVLDRVRGAAARPLDEAREPGLLGGVTIVLHRGAGAYICGEETGAARVARGQARPAALEAAVPGDRRPLRVADADQQRRDDRDRARSSSRSAAASTRRSGAARLGRARASSRLSGNVANAGRLRARARPHRCAS